MTTELILLTNLTTKDLFELHKQLSNFLESKGLSSLLQVSKEYVLERLEPTTLIYFARRKNIV